MKVFTCAGISGFWVEGHAVVVANSKTEAVLLLNQELRSKGLAADIEEHDLDEVQLDKPQAIILNDGDY